MLYLFTTLQITIVWTEQKTLFALFTGTLPYLLSARFQNNLIGLKTLVVGTRLLYC